MYVIQHQLTGRFVSYTGYMDERIDKAMTFDNKEKAEGALRYRHCTRAVGWGASEIVQIESVTTWRVVS